MVFPCHTTTRFPPPHTPEDCRYWIGPSWDSIWMETVAETAIFGLSGRPFERREALHHCRKTRRKELLDAAMTKAFGRHDVELTHIREAPMSSQSFPPTPWRQEADRGDSSQRKASRLWRTTFAAYVHCSTHLHHRFTNSG
jgi:hypothetical protein